jgi:hypothetical protein
MKRIACFCIVSFTLLNVSAFAQPVHGPFVVIGNEESNYRTPHIVPLTQDSLAVFYVDELMVAYVEFSLITETNEGRSRLIGGGGGHPHSIVGAACSYAPSDSRWAILERCGDFDGEEVRCIFQVGDATENRLLSEFYFPSGPYGGRSNINYSIHSDFSGGWYVTLINEGSDNPIGEWNATPYYVSVSPASIDSFHIVNCYHDLDYEHCGSGPGYFQCTQTASGPLFVYGIFYDFESILLFPDSLAMFDPFDETLHWEMNCSVTPFDFQQTRSGRFIAFNGRETYEYSPEYNPQGVATFDTSGACDIIMLPEIPRDPDALSFHPDFGWALLFHNQNSLSVATVDTNGTVITLPGVLYWHEGETAIMDADVTLTDDGKVVAVWSERDAWNQPATRLMLAWTGWDTQLDSPDQSPTPVPQTFSLSTYPNPFNSEVQIDYSLPKAEDVSLSVYNLNGQLVESLVNGHTTAGEHTATWTPKSSAGVYFISLQTATQQKTQKVLYLK